MTVPVRLMTRDDAAAAHILHTRAFPEAEVWSAWALQDTLALSTTLGLATEEEGQLSGMIIVQKVPPDADILTMCVHPEKQRQGLATHLLNGMLGLLGPAGVSKLYLDVAEDNDAAIAFYESSGFLADGRRKGYYQREGGVQMDAILMSRPIAGHIAESEA